LTCIYFQRQLTVANLVQFCLWFYLLANQAVYRTLKEKFGAKG